jgi:hypothetical protein
VSLFYLIFHFSFFLSQLDSLISACMYLNTQEDRSNNYTTHGEIFALSIGLLDVYTVRLVIMIRWFPRLFCAVCVLFFLSKKIWRSCYTTRIISRRLNCAPQSTREIYWWWWCNLRRSAGESTQNQRWEREASDLTG